MNICAVNKKIKNEGKESNNVENLMFWQFLCQSTGLPTRQASVQCRPPDWSKVKWSDWGCFRKWAQHSTTERGNGGRWGRKAESGGWFTGSPSRQQEDKAVCLPTLPAYHVPIHSQHSPWHIESLSIMVQWLLLQTLQLSLIYLVWLERHFNVWWLFLSMALNNESVLNINIL